MLKDRALTLYIYLSLFQKTKARRRSLLPAFLFSLVSLWLPQISRRELRDQDHKPHKPQKPQKPQPVLGKSLFPKKSHRNWERPQRQQPTRLRQQQPQQRTPKLRQQQRGGVAPNLPPWETLICVYQPKVVLCCAQWCRVFWCFQVYSPLVLQIWARSPMTRGPRPRFLRPYSGDVLAWRSSFTFRSWWWPPRWKEIWCFLAVLVRRVNVFK